MAYLKLGQFILDMASIDLINLHHQMPLSQDTVVRIQLKNRRDEVVIIGGKPTHIKHGVFELEPDLSEKFRWFIDTFGAQLGVLDVERGYAQKDQIADLKAKAEAEARNNAKSTSDTLSLSKLKRL